MTTITYCAYDMYEGWHTITPYEVHQTSGYHKNCLEIWMIISKTFIYC